MAAGICQRMITAISQVVNVGEEFEIVDISDLVTGYAPQEISRSIAVLCAGSDPTLERVVRGRYRLIKIRDYEPLYKGQSPSRAFINRGVCPDCLMQLPSSGVCGSC